MACRAGCHFTTARRRLFQKEYQKKILSGFSFSAVHTGGYVIGGVKDPRGFRGNGFRREKYFIFVYTQGAATDCRALNVICFREQQPLKKRWVRREKQANIKKWKVSYFKIKINKKYRRFYGSRTKNAGIFCCTSEWRINTKRRNLKGHKNGRGRKETPAASHMPVKAAAEIYRNAVEKTFERIDSKM